MNLMRNTANLGFARANNQGIRASRVAMVMLLNSDTVVPATPHELVRFMDSQSDAGACGPRLVRADGSPQPYAFGGDPTPGYLLGGR